MNSSVSGKKLLVLGGTYASYDLVRLAKEMGVYTVVADYYETGMAKEIADEAVTISTTDIEGLCALIKEKKIDGVFCGPSEFNIRNMIRLCEATGLPCYTDMALWDKCAIKDKFTEACRAFGVNVPEEYNVYEGMSEAELDKIDYPIIIKPVDGSSSVGISVCRKKEDVLPALKKATEASTSKRAIAERYIENNGEIFNVRYFVRNGEAYPYFLMDTYITDPVGRTGLFDTFALGPSKYSDYYMNNMDRHVRAMIKGIGIKEGTVFFQSLPYKGKIYFIEMGYRLSGGMIFKLTEPLMNVNDIKIMIRYALGGEGITPEEINRIDLQCGGRIGAQLMIPVNAGTVGKIEGLEEAVAIPEVTNLLQYYKTGDTVKKESIGTLSQNFARFSIIADNEKEIENVVSKIHSILKVYDTNGNKMNVLQFDFSRTKAHSDVSNNR